MIVGYKINTQKSVLFPYTNNEQSEKGIKKITPFTKSHSKELKYRNKFNHNGERPIDWKLRNIAERN